MDDLQRARIGIAKVNALTSLVALTHESRSEPPLMAVVAIEGSMEAWANLAARLQRHFDEGVDPAWIASQADKALGYMEEATRRDALAAVFIHLPELRLKEQLERAFDQDPTPGK